MSINHRLFMDTTATRHELRDVLVEAGLGFEARLDSTGRPHGLPDLSNATSPATVVTILNERDYSWMPDNGVLPTQCVSFHDRRLYQSDPSNPMKFDKQTVQGVVALLRAFPDAGAYLEGWDARVPLLLRRGGRLVLSEQKAQPGEFWDPGRRNLQALVDLPHVVEPLGPWEYGPVRAPAAAE